MGTLVVNTDWMTLAITSTGANGEFRGASEWVRVEPEWNRGRGWLEVQGISGTGTEVAVAIELATDILNPLSPHTKLMTVVTTNGTKNPDATAVTINFAGAKYARVGFHGKVTSGTGFVHVRGRAELFQT